MKIKIKNAYIFSEDKLFFGEILIEKGVIINIARNVDDADEIIDAKNNLVLPGFINCHTHSPMSLLKNTSSENELENWAKKDIFPKESKFISTDYYWGAMLSIAEMLKNGITCFCDSYMGEEYVFEAIKRSGIRANLCLGFHNSDEKDLEKIYLNLIKDNVNTIKFSFYAHSIYLCLPSQFDKLVELRAKYNIPLYAHVSETLKEVGDCVNEFNKTPIELLESYGFFDGKSTIAHAVHLDKCDYDILNKYDVNVVSCPSSNLKLASGICPLTAIKNNQINIALGTDGSASNNQLNMFKEMFLANALQREQMHDANVISLLDTYKMATQNGAKVVGYDNIGSLKIGSLADLIIVNLNSINFLNTNNILEQIIFNCETNDILLTMVNGKVLYEDGKFYIGESIENIKHNCKNINLRLTI